ncbi:HU family DNA-binding protein [Nonomuraea sp. NPDC050663]|uniref:HU family DNA-binding protein n=1 Tax=Nonomuraea sp. NPDC050663 TaxID=3364370 RepID=UPI003789AD06
MNQTQLVAELAARHNLPKPAMQAIVSDLFDTIQNTVAAGGEVSIQNWGKFTATTHKAGTARNPRTGVEVQVPQRRRPTLRPGKGFVAAVNGQ